MVRADKSESDVAKIAAAVAPHARSGAASSAPSAAGGAFTIKVKVTMARDNSSRSASTAMELAARDTTAAEIDPVWCHSPSGDRWQVLCDGCDRQIHPGPGARWKSVTRANYDLCSECLARRWPEHADEIFLHVPQQLRYEIDGLCTKLRGVRTGAARCVGLGGAYAGAAARPAPLLDCAPSTHRHDTAHGTTAASTSCASWEVARAGDLDRVPSAASAAGFGSSYVPRLDPRTAALANTVPRHDVLCDRCDKFLEGCRYKCSVCLDMDFCDRCYWHGHDVDSGPTHHDPSHLFFAIPLPMDERAASQLPLDKCLTTGEGTLTSGHNSAGVRVERLPPYAAATGVVRQVAALESQAFGSQAWGMNTLRQAASPTAKRFLDVATVSAMEAEEAKTAQLAAVTSDDARSVAAEAVGEPSEVDVKALAMQWGGDAARGPAEAPPGAGASGATDLCDRTVVGYVAFVMEDVHPKQTRDGRRMRRRRGAPVPSFELSADGACAVDRLEVDDAPPEQACYVASLAVSPHYRRKGVGRSLLRHTVQAAAGRDGCIAVWLHVRADNPGAQRLYESEGFVVVGVERLFYRDVDGFVMRKDLARRPPSA